jgi:hypothetical protein
LEIQTKKCQKKNRDKKIKRTIREEKD